MTLCDLVSGGAVGVHLDWSCHRRQDRAEDNTHTKLHSGQ